MAKTKLSEKKFFPYTVGAVVALVIVGAFRLFNSQTSYDSVYYGEPMMNVDYSAGSDYFEDSPMSLEKSSDSSYNTVYSSVDSRVITNNYFSVHVESVEEYHLDIKKYVKEIDGKIMSEDVNESSNQSENGTIRVFIPNSEAEDFLDLLKEKSIKIVDQSVTSYEISSQYADVNRSIDQLEETYSKVLSFYNSAETVSDLVSIQNQLTSLQNQIDSYKGVLRELKERSENTEFTIYSGTNEYDLPYVPDGTFEISKTFKMAVRSLVGFADSAISVVVYILVFAPVWLIVLGVVIFVRKRTKTSA